MSDGLLNGVHSPQDIKRLSFDQLHDLAGEIRQLLITQVAQGGGHLASNLGAVELTLALHKVFDLPNDQIVWDVGHQSYTHKIITGRREAFSTLRQKDGLSGFPKRDESEYDAFIAGHASASISAACGLARANAINRSDNYVVAVIGDGALTGGMAYEGLNNAGRGRDNLIVVLNDNDMSISPNVGAMAKYLARVRSRPFYFRLKDVFERLLLHIPLIGRPLRDLLFKSKSLLKDALYRSTLFENMGFLYLGPINGHDIKAMCEVLSRARSLKRPVLLHVNTIKGKGYSFAEEKPHLFHGISGFDMETGDIGSSGENFSCRFGKELVRFAQDDNRICAITAAMMEGTGLTEFAQTFKNRFYDVGIAEEHAVTFAGGLAAGGMLPVFAVYSTFLQRGYDQVIHDLALQKLKVVLAVDRAGLVGEDGETHQGIFDVPFLRSVPGITIYSPATYSELSYCLDRALYKDPGVVAVRYPRGGAPLLPDDYHFNGRPFELYGGGKADTLIVAYGRLFAQAVGAREQLLAHGADTDILKLSRIAPLDKSYFEQMFAYKEIHIFEECVREGCVGEAIAARLLELGFSGACHVHAIDDGIVKQGKLAELLAELELDARGMTSAVVGHAL